MRKYLQACCAMCGSIIRGTGWFCSQRCEEFEMCQRRGNGKELFEQGRPIKRAQA